MSRTHLAVRVELVCGRGQACWPLPGRVLLAGRTMTFGALTGAVDAAFGRWDLAHLHTFDLADGEQFAYTFGLDDDWTHLCTVAPARVDPHEVYGAVPAAPVPMWGWGELPDQYGRRFDGDTDDADELPPRPDPPFSDLPPLLA